MASWTYLFHHFSKIRIQRTVVCIELSTLFPFMPWFWLYLTGLHPCIFVSISTDSFKILSDIPLKEDAKLSVHGNISVLTTQSSIRILRPSLFPPRPRPKDDIAPTSAEIFDEESHALRLQADKERLWKEAEELDSKEFPFPGALAKINLDDAPKSSSFNAALYYGMLVYVGKGEEIRVWKLRPSSDGTWKGQELVTQAAE